MFDSNKISKEIFNILNDLKLHPKKLISKLERLVISEKCNFGESDRKEVIDILQSLPASHKAKSYLWNEKAVNLLRLISQKKVNGETLEEDFEKTIENFSSQSHHEITGTYFVNGKYDSETIVLHLILENSKDVRKILIETGQIASICSVTNKSRMKVLTSFVFAKTLKKN